LLEWSTLLGECGQGGLDVLTELVLEEDLAELLAFAQLNHSLNIVLLALGRALIHGEIRNHGSLRRIVFLRLLQFRVDFKRLLHQLDFEKTDLLALLVKLGFKVQLADLLADVVEVLGLSRADVLLQHVVQNLLFYLLFVIILSRLWKSK